MNTAVRLVDRRVASGIYEREERGKDVPLLSESVAYRCPARGPFAQAAG